MASTDTQGILVVGGGMSGLTAAIEAAEAGYDTYVVEKNPYLGGEWRSSTLLPQAVSTPLRAGDSTSGGSKTIHAFVLHPCGSGVESPELKGILTWRSG